jgi:hypothetical protein
MAPCITFACEKVVIGYDNQSIFGRGRLASGLIRLCLKSQNAKMEYQRSCESIQTLVDRHRGTH